MALRQIILVALSLALASCSRIGFDGPSRQYSGVWLNAFEGSTFVEGATAIPRTQPEPKDTDWLDYRLDRPGLEALVDPDGYDDARGCYTVQPFRVTFIGHRTWRPFGAGHLGLWRSQMTADRTIAFERLGPAFCYDG